MADPDWQRFEQLVADIQRDLAPTATVSHNVKLPGRDSETDRQIDVLVEQTIGQYTVRIVIDCKDYGRPVDVKGVEEFIGMVRDVGAHQGSMVCPKGFTTSAKKRAKKDNIALFSLVDTANHKWQTRGVMVPAICDFRTAAIGFGIRCTAPVPFQLSEDFLTTLEAYADSGKALGVPLNVGLERWNQGVYPVDVGMHDDVPLYETRTVLVDNGHGQRVPVDLYVSLIVQAQRYWGLLPLEQVRGLRDEETGLLHTNGFSTGGIDPVAVQNQWKRLEENEQEPDNIAMRFMGLVGYEAKDDPRAAPGYSAFWPRRQGASRGR